MFRRMYRDAGLTVARLVQQGTPLVDLEVCPLSLEEAIAALGGPP